MLDGDAAGRRATDAYARKVRGGCAPGPAASAGKHCRSGSSFTAVTRTCTHADALEELVVTPWGVTRARPRSKSAQGFTAVDPLADHPNQVDKSPYAYAWNNPTNLTDPDGKCPNCGTGAIGAGVGFVVGGLISIGTQAWNGDINWGQALIDGGQGAIVGGALGFAGPAGLSYLGVSGASIEGAAVGFTVGAGANAVAEPLAQGAEIAIGTRSSFSRSEVASNMLVGGGAAVLGTGVGALIKPVVATAARSAPAVAASIQTATSGQAVKGAQRAAVKTLGSFATNAEKTAARSAVRTEVKQTVRAAADAQASKVGARAGTAAGASVGTTVKSFTQNLYNEWNP